MTTIQANRKYTLDTSKLFAMFDSARRQGVTKPAIRMTAGGVPVKFKAYGTKIYVNSDPFGTTYATICNGGYVYFSPGFPEKLPRVIQALAADPIAVCRAYGLTLCHCCFCGRDLSDDRSTTVGYGPICAGKYGLPWGEMEAVGA